MSEQCLAPDSRPKILLVEDSPRLQEILTDFLRTLPGLELAGTAATAAEAMIAFGAHRPDVVILDLVLREGSGFEVLREIKQRTPACQVLVFTGFDDDTFRTRCLAAGADRYFSKNRQHGELIQWLQALAGDPVAAGVSRSPTSRS